MATAAAEGFRKAFVSNEEENERLRRECKYADNCISTSKYTAVNFVPKILFEFFRVVANCYFLVISILQVSTTWSPTNKYTTAGPLLVVLAVSMIKQGVEDRKRHEADARQNAQKSRVLSPSGELVEREWRELRVGDVLCLHDRDEAPADVFILSTSEEEGRCFVETCNLDGETNLKRRTAIEAVAQHIGHRALNDPPVPEAAHRRAIAAFRGALQYEQPNNRLYNFTGRLEVLGQGVTAPIGPTNVILRGCSVRGCSFVFGVVLFTGAETKIMQNARATPSKQSNVYRIVNRCILLIFATQAALCVISTICSALWVRNYEERMWYFGGGGASSASSVESFFTFLILYNNLVPISLYVSLDMVKVTQAKNISHDPEMAHNGKLALARTSDLNEELGQVQHIFSDKTGTLTQNIMEFRKCFVAGTSFGFGTTEIGRAVAAMAKKAPPVGSTTGGEPTEARQPQEQQHDPRRAQVHFNPGIHFDDPRLIDALDRGGPEATAIDAFLTVLAVCHTVIPEKNERDGTVDYRASSPDEEALVKAAKCLGYDFLTPAPVVDVRVTTKSGRESMRRYTVLNVNEFNSTRKRMSVVVRTQDDRFLVYCKGADNVMLPRSRPDTHSSAMAEELRRFASEGLRTLVLCAKEISEAEYRAWDDKYHEAVTALSDRDRRLEEVAEEIETDMDVVGATAIEDKLQEGVPSTIFHLASAGIKIWMLTGDKEETAINIAHACRLINDDMKLLVLNEEHLPSLIKQLEHAFQVPRVQEYLRLGKVSSHLALVCDGKAMVHVFPPANAPSDAKGVAAELASKLLAIASVCQAVVACRVSPAQKADVVNLVRHRLPGKKVITLAIGDGANDVNMIQSAHVGVGISGQEGVQAVNASDYAIAQFRFLERLLLVHGRFNYQRITKVILYSFYKNVALVIALFLFNFYNGQSGSSVFESFVMAGWNFFLALPIIAIGVFDEDVAPAQAMTHPELYLAGQRNEGLNVRRFASWIANAVLQALLCFLLTVHGTTNVGGIGAALYLQGSVVYSTLLMSANAKVVLETQSWTKPNKLFLAFSLLLFFFFLLVFPLFGDLGKDLFGVSTRMLGSPIFWLYLLLLPFAANLLDICVKYTQITYFPSAANILREKNVVPPSAAQVACEQPLGPLRQPERRRSSRIVSATIPQIDEYSGYAFSAPDADEQRPERDLASMRVLQLNEKLRSFDRTSAAQPSARPSARPDAKPDADPNSSI